jgi:sugar/nucleoside kinase (ribokinase family)
MSETFDAVVAGHICLDVTPAMYAGGKNIADIFRPGKLIAVGPATVSTGGPVSNTGLPLRRLGVNVALMGKCGDDMFGRAILDCIRREAPGAEAGMHVVRGEQTSYTVVVNPPGIDRIFLHCTGANDTFASGDIDLEKVRRAKLLHFGYPPLMAKTYADGGAELVKIFEQVKTAGATTSLDMAYPDPAGPAGKVDWRTILTRTLPHVDIFTPSVEELLFMLRRRQFEELMGLSAGRELLDFLDVSLLGELGEECIAAGAAVVLIKCGYHGLYVRTAGRGRLEKLGRAKAGNPAVWTNRELFEPSYKVDHIVSATGAGDCAIAAFLAGFLNGCELDDVLRCACAVGAQNLSAPDSISGVKTWRFTLDQVAARPPKSELKLAMTHWRYDATADHYTGPRDGKC